MPMLLGVQTHFGQGWNLSLATAAEQLASDFVRDGIAWQRVETAKGRYVFDVATTTYLDALAARGTEVTLVMTGGNSLYDGGNTPYSAGGRAAFAKFVNAVLDRFPAVKTIEIGNEFNANGFVSGPVLTAPASQRDDYYAALFKAVDDAVSPRHPDVRILGGATHSIPVDYVRDLFALGLDNRLDALTIHPYTTTPEQFGDQMQMLRQAFNGRDIPVHVTEFGQDFASLAEAPGYLIKMVTAMSAAGVAEANWYALARQPFFPNMELVEQNGTRVPAGDAFAFAQTLLAKGDAVRLGSDPFSHFYRFGTSAAVLWGEAQTVSISGNVRYHDAQGRLLTNFDGRISPDAPVIAISDTPIMLGQTLTSSGTGIVADSFHQFDLVKGPGEAANPWSYFALTAGGAQVKLGPMGGGLVAGEGWTPYLGAANLRPLAVTARAVNPVDFTNNSAPGSGHGIMERYTSDYAGTVTIRGHWDVKDSSRDGIVVRVLHNGKELTKQAVNNKPGGYVFDLSLPNVQLAVGDRIDFITLPGADSIGSDTTERRLTIVASDGSGEPPIDPPPTPTPTGSATVGADQLDFSAVSGAVIIDGLAGDDRITGTAGDDRLTGGAGRDTLIGGDGNDILLIDAEDRSIDGGAGEDAVIVRGSAAVTLDLAASQIEKATGGSGSDSFRAGAASGAVTLNGLGGNDRLTGGAFADLVNGGEGLDILFGQGGNDVLNGGGGNDRLEGGTGNDRLSGGSGNDIFVFSADWGADVVSDFTAGDRLDLSALPGVEGLANLSLTTAGSAVVVSFQTATITLLATSLTEISAADFLF